MTSTNIIFLIIVGPYSIFMIIIITIYLFIMIFFYSFALCTYAYKITCMLYDKNDLFSDYIIIICTSCCIRIIMLLPFMCF